MPWLLILCYIWMTRYPLLVSGRFSDYREPV
jgi:hypothetical protein